MEPTSSIKDASETIKGIVEAVPIYEDLLQPAVQELGKGLHTVSKTVHIALAPISVMVWGFDQIKEYVQRSLEKKLEHVSAENIIIPDLAIAGPTLEAMRFTGQNEELREMFINLLATSMNRTEADKAHPAYVEIIKQLSSDEAKILKHIKTDFFPLLSIMFEQEGVSGRIPLVTDFSDVADKAGCNNSFKVVAYLDNLKRLGLISFLDNYRMADVSSYIPLREHDYIKSQFSLVNYLGKPSFKESSAKVTVFGKIFYETCVTQ